MKKVIALRERKKEFSDDYDAVGKNSSSSHSQSSASSSSSSDTAALSRKYFNDTIPVETVRSTLPHELAEEYLSFVQQCGKRRCATSNSKDDAPNQHKENPNKRVAKSKQSVDNNKPSADHKENK